MRRRNLLNIALLAVVVLLALTVWFGREEAGKNAPPRLTSLNPEQIQTIRIKNQAGPEYVMERKEDGWVMTSPYQIDANTPRINILLDITATPSFKHFPVPEERLAEFGLVPPGAVLQLNETRIEFGTTHPLNYRRYLRIVDRIHLTNDHFPHHLLASAEAYIAHELLPGKTKITSIQTDEWRITRDTQGRWTVEPAQPGQSADTLNHKIDNWRHALAIAVVPLPEGKPEGWVVIGIEGEPKPLRFGILRTRKQLLLTRPDLNLAYRIPTDSPLLTTPPAP